MTYLQSMLSGNIETAGRAWLARARREQAKGVWVGAARLCPHGKPRRLAVGDVTACSQPTCRLFSGYVSPSANYGLPNRFFSARLLVGTRAD